MVTYSSGATVITYQKDWIKVLDTCWNPNPIHLFRTLHLLHVQFLTYSPSGKMNQYQNICGLYLTYIAVYLKWYYFNFILRHSELKITLICKMLVLRMYCFGYNNLTATIADLLLPGLLESSLRLFRTLHVNRLNSHMLFVCCYNGLVPYFFISRVISWKKRNTILYQFGLKRMVAVFWWYVSDVTFVNIFTNFEEDVVRQNICFSV